MKSNAPYSANILITNFQSDSSILPFQKFTIHSCQSRYMTVRNLQQAKEIFPGHNVTYSHHYIQREYTEIPPDPRDQVGLGRIPYDSEDLMLLLRLFKPGDIGFDAQVLHTLTGSGSQYPYPQVFSVHHTNNYYVLKSTECAAFDKFFAEAPTWPGWKSAWFRVSRRYFLWGSSKEFNIERERSEDWELERILDFYTALEAAIVPEHDFGARRLRERAAVLLQLSTDAAKALKKRFTELYAVRSSVAHGGIRKHVEEDAKNREKEKLSILMPAFEQDVRDLLKAALQHSPTDEKERENWLKSLYDPSDRERADRIKQEFNSIRSDLVKHELLEDLNRSSNE